LCATVLPVGRSYLRDWDPEAAGLTPASSSEGAAATSLSEQIAGNSTAKTTTTTKVNATVPELQENVRKLEEELADLESQRIPNELKLLRGRKILEYANAGDDILCRYLSCAKCVASKTCGWCASSQTCMEGNRIAPLGNGTCAYWNFEACESGCGTSPDCAGCVSRIGCGFCYDSCECLQGNRMGPAFNRTCNSGWYHSKLSEKKTCAAPQQWPGTWPPGIPYDVKVCAAKQFHRLRMISLGTEATRTSALEFAKIMEQDDSELY